MHRAIVSSTEVSHVSCHSGLRGVSGCRAAGCRQRRVSSTRRVTWSSTRRPEAEWAAEPTPTSAWRSGAKPMALDSERLKHLAIAVLTEPAHATARGLLGLVAFRGRWQSPEAIRDRLAAEETTSATLAEYNRRARPHGQFRRRSLEDRAVVRAAGAQARGHRPPDDGHAARPRPRGRLEATRVQETRTALGHRSSNWPPRRPRRKLRKRLTGGGRHS